MQPTALPAVAITKPDSTANPDHDDQHALGPSTPASPLKKAKLSMKGQRSAHHQKNPSLTTRNQDRDGWNSLTTNFGKVGSDFVREEERMIEEVIIESEVHVRRVVTGQTESTRFAEERDEYLEEIEEISPGK